VLGVIDRASSEGLDEEATSALVMASTGVV
jgi:hypothetical protein